MAEGNIIQIKERFGKIIHNAKAIYLDDKHYINICELEKQLDLIVSTLETKGKTFLNKSYAFNAQMPMFMISDTDQEYIMEQNALMERVIIANWKELLSAAPCGTSGGVACIFLLVCEQFPKELEFLADFLVLHFVKKIRWHIKPRSLISFVRTCLASDKLIQNRKDEVVLLCSLNSSIIALEFQQEFNAALLRNVDVEGLKYVVAYMCAIGRMTYFSPDEVYELLLEQTEKNGESYVGKRYVHLYHDDDLCRWFNPIEAIIELHIAKKLNIWSAEECMKNAKLNRLFSLAEKLYESGLCIAPQVITLANNSRNFTVEFVLRGQVFTLAPHEKRQFDGLREKGIKYVSLEIRTISPFRFELFKINSLYINAYVSVYETWKITNKRSVRPGCIAQFNKHLDIATKFQELPPQIEKIIKDRLHYAIYYEPDESEDATIPSDEMVRIVAQELRVEYETTLRQYPSMLFNDFIAEVSGCDIGPERGRQTNIGMRLNSYMRPEHLKKAIDIILGN